MENKAVIFDLDGTLIDSVPDIAYNINLMLKKFGYKTLEKQRIQDFVGHGARQLCKDCIECTGNKITEKELDERLAFYNEKYTNSGSPNTYVYDGVKEMLKTLKERGYKLAILTNKPQSTTDSVYSRYLSEFNFDMVVGQQNGVKCKPDKTATVNILKELDCKPENAYFVGDGETDYLTSVNSGTIGISTLWGYNSKSKLLSFGAKQFASSPKDLLSLIK